MTKIWKAREFNTIREDGAKVVNENGPMINDSPIRTGPHQVTKKHLCAITGLHWHGDDPSRFFRPPQGSHWRVGNDCRIVSSYDGDSVLCPEHRWHEDGTERKLLVDLEENSTIREFIESLLSPGVEDEILEKVREKMRRDLLGDRVVNTALEQWEIAKAAARERAENPPMMVEFPDYVTEGTDSDRPIEPMNKTREPWVQKNTEREWIESSSIIEVTRLVSKHSEKVGHPFRRQTNFEYSCKSCNFSVVLVPDEEGVVEADAFDTFHQARTEERLTDEVRERGATYRESIEDWWDQVRYQIDKLADSYRNWVSRKK